MKKVLFILTLALFSCEKSNDEPTTSVNNDCAAGCMCGEIVSVNQYYPDLFFTYEVQNNCTGAITVTTNETYYDYGLDMCLDYCW
jgi:hypothetical protein